MFIIAGLGNPGRTYKGTRHNIGFAVVETLAKRHSLEFRKKLGWKSEVAIGKIEEVDVCLMKPLTFMNQSGEAVALAMRDASIDCSRLIVIIDDVALPFGQLRMRSKGSAGGHNGLKSVEEHLQAQNYPRLRVGVGEEGDEDLVSHVLGKFSADEKELIPEILEKASKALEIWLERGLNHAMDFANSSPPNPSNGE